MTEKVFLEMTKNLQYRFTKFLFCNFKGFERPNGVPHILISLFLDYHSRSPGTSTAKVNERTSVLILNDFLVGFYDIMAFAVRPAVFPSNAF